MARFRLKGKHYLNVPGIEYEYKEEAQGPIPGKKRIMRKVNEVPMYLDPDDPSDHNYPGEIIIATATSRQFPHDIIFVGSPTPDMEPLDEEADALFEQHRPLWEKNHPIENLPTTYADNLLEKMLKQLESLGGRKPTTDIENVSVAQFDQLKKDNEALTERVNKLMAMLENQSEKPSVRRV